jgi:hypothetical protein
MGNSTHDDDDDDDDDEDEDDDDDAKFSLAPRPDGAESILNHIHMHDNRDLNPTLC